MRPVSLEGFTACRRWGRRGSSCEVLPWLPKPAVSVFKAWPRKWKDTERTSQPLLGKESRVQNLLPLGFQELTFGAPSPSVFQRLGIGLNNLTHQTGWFQILETMIAICRDLWVPCFLRHAPIGWSIVQNVEAVAQQELRTSLDLALHCTQLRLCPLC